MQIKATLNKPYEDNERMAFIVEQNHQRGYEIRETETALEAWGKTDEEKAQAATEQARKELVAQLDSLDLKAIRALRAIQAGTSTEEDTARLATLETQAAAIRRQIQQLGE